MKYKIERIKLDDQSVKRNFYDFIDAVAKLKKGQSFVWHPASNDRMAVSIIEHLFDRRFITKAVPRTVAADGVHFEGKQMRRLARIK